MSLYYTSLKELSSQEDIQLMQELQNGNHTALVVIMRRYKHMITVFVRKLVADPAQIDDIVQETFIRVFRFAHQYDKQGRFTNWLFTIAANVAKTELRRAKQRQMAPLSYIDKEDDQQAVERQICDTRYMPDSVIEKELLSEYIQQALMKISPTNRQAVVLRDILQLSYEEISQVIQCEIGTVKSRINRARQVLRQQLGPFYECIRQDTSN